MRIGRALIGALAAWTLSSCQLPQAGHNVALLYGISEYDTDYALGLGPNLTFPSADVEALSPLLSSAQGGLFDTVLARTETTPARATKAQMTADFAAAAAQMGPDSLFLFYYSGHGDRGHVPGLMDHSVLIPLESYYYLGQTPTYVASKMVTENELRDLLATLPTKKVIVILDSCYSGGFIQSAPGTDPVPQDSAAYYRQLWKAFLAGQAPGAGTELSAWYNENASGEAAALASWTQALTQGSGIAAGTTQLLTAAGGLELSYDAEDWGHGAFSHFLLRSRDEGDADGNGYVTVSEAYRYAFAGLQEQWNGVWGAVGAGSFVTTGDVFLPHLAGGPTDYLLFKR